MPQLIPGFQTANGDIASASYLNGWWSSAGMTVSSAVAIVGNVTGVSGTVGASNWQEVLLGTNLTAASSSSGTWSISAPAFAASSDVTAGTSNSLTITPLALANGANLASGYVRLDSNAYVPIANLPPYTAENFIMVEVAQSGSAAATSNGQTLLNTYATAIAKTPNGSAISTTNRVQVILPPAVYDLGGQTLTLSTSFVDIVGLSGVQSTDCAIIQSAVTSSSAGVVSFTSATPTVQLRNLILKNTGTTSANTSNSSTFACVVFTTQVLRNVVFDTVEFVGTNIFHTGTNFGNSVSRCYFKNCIVSSIAYTVNFNLDLDRCSKNNANPNLTSVSVPLTGDPTSFTSGTMWLSNGSFTAFNNAIITPAAPIVGASISLTSSTLVAGGPIAGASFIGWTGSYISILGAASAATSTVSGIFTSCWLDLSASVQPATVLGSLLFKAGVMTCSTSNLVSISGFPKFYGTRFQGPLALTAAGSADLQHCNLPSTWGSPTNLTLVCGSAAAGFNYVSTNSNFDSP